MKTLLTTLFVCICITLLGQSAELFLPISNPLANRDIAISPDGQLLLSTAQSIKREKSVIILAKKNGDQWTEPIIAPFSGEHSDLEPAFSPDGKRLYFASNRPTVDNKEKKDYDLWYVEKQGENWSEAVRLPDIINTSANEFYPSITNDGSIYFTATYEDTKGKEDIYVSRYKDGKYEKPESLSEGVNSATWEFNAFVAPDESYILFSSFGREDDMGGGDLYISTKSEDGNWMPAEQLPSTVNGPTLDYCPFVDANGNLYFTSSRPEYKEAMTYKEIVETHNKLENGLDNVYVISLEEVLGLME